MAATGSVEEKYGVESIHKTRESKQIHFNEDCQYLGKSNRVMDKPASAFPVGFYEVCEECLRWHDG